MPKRSTCGVNWMPAGKCPLIPTGATKPGPYNVELPSGLGTSGLDCTSRCVIVVWLMSWIVREVKRRLVVREIGAGPRQRDSPVDGEDFVGRVVCNLRRNATLDSDTEDRPIAIDDSDDRVVDVGGRGGPLQKGLDVAGCQHLVGFGRRGGISWIDRVVAVHTWSDIGAAGDGRGYLGNGVASGRAEQQRAARARRTLGLSPSPACVEF